MRDGETAFARIAADDLTRIALAGGPHPVLARPQGRLAIEKNARTGQIYVRPLGRASRFPVPDRRLGRHLCAHPATRGRPPRA